MRAKYCKCKNTYTTEDCKYNNKRCNAPDYWSQGIGSLTGGGVSNVNNESSDRTVNGSRSGIWE